jgi:SAM-dependent methyltransferase
MPCHSWLTEMRQDFDPVRGSIKVESIVFKSLSQIRKSLPAASEPIAIRMWYLCRPIIRLIFFGRNRYCCVCDSWGRLFLSHGLRKDIVCPICLAHDRHRLAWIYLNSCTNLTDGSPKKLLHFAPETAFTQRFKKIPEVDYVSADPVSPHAMVKLDITDIHLPDSSFDIIYCSHVLEHVPEDRQAMSEMFRVLKPGGWALIQVPVSKNATLEDPSITDPVERERLFWQSDHVRLYGLDIKDRLAAAGFDVAVVLGHQFIEPQDCTRMGIDPNDPMFHCRKPAG